MTKIPRFLGGAGVLALAFVIVGLRAQREPREQQFRDDRQHVTEPGDPGEQRFPTNGMHVTEPGDPALRDRMMKGYALVRKGKAALTENDLQRAESLFREVLALDRTNSEAWAGIAEALEKQGKTSEAIVAYRTLTNPGPKWGSTLVSDPAVLMRYAVLLIRANQWPEAVQVYEKAAGRLNDGQGAALPPLPTNFSPQMRRPADLAAMAHVGLGRAQAKRGRSDAALAEFAQAAKLRPNSAVAQFYYGYGLKAVGRAAEAKAAFTRAAAAAAAAATSGQGEVKTAAENELR